MPRSHKYLRESLARETAKRLKAADAFMAEMDALTAGRDTSGEYVKPSGLTYIAAPPRAKRSLYRERTVSLRPSERAYDGDRRRPYERKAA